MEERYYWLGFSLFPGIGPKKFQLLLDAFGTARQAWDGGELQLREIIGPLTSQKFIAFRKSFPFGDYKESLQKKHIVFTTLAEESYPQKLATISNPPFVLYIKGNASVFEESHPYVGIVGTRKITQYGRDATTLITKELVTAGYVIVSGLAMGVDATAHMVTIENKGVTIAVLGCGVDCCSPRENLVLYDRILENGGVIVSEIPPGIGPTAGSFPARNRIIAGLSDGIVVTEGTQDSGALYTAGDAFKENRKVFAVPGPITSVLSQAPLSLLQKGAIIVTNASDILKEFEVDHIKQRSIKKRVIQGESGEEQEIIDLLSNEALHIDEIVRRVGRESSVIGSVLSIMEIKGFITQTDNIYSLVL